MTEHSKASCEAFVLLQDIQENNTDLWNRITSSQYQSVSNPKEYAEDNSDDEDEAQDNIEVCLWKMSVIYIMCCTDQDNDKSKKNMRNSDVLVPFALQSHSANNACLFFKTISLHNEADVSSLIYNNLLLITKQLHKIC
jgi:hypothetical protein